VGATSFGGAWSALTRDESAAHDLVQEVLIVVWPHLALLGDGSACERWLHAAVPFVVLGRVVQSLRSLAGLVGTSGDDDETGNVIDTAPGPANDDAEAMLIAKETRSALTKAVASLAELDREVIVRTASGESPSDIAQALGLSPVAVRVRLCRTRARLTTTLRRNSDRAT
ncbi:MAG: sigma-70 family RNA polymerase sigma factor, partial [Polyangiaceae bacterium]|nr:sigma-70 family RNA polymerase sigma factor [Polyangiaceae bacterium]